MKVLSLGVCLTLALAGCASHQLSSDPVQDAFARNEVATARAEAEASARASQRPKLPDWVIERYNRQQELDRKEAALHRELGDRPSDVADCRSRGNAVFGEYLIKMKVMDDCLDARRLRRHGH